MKKNKRRTPAAPDVCPVCGEDVPRGALACPECGADHNSGWREDAEIYDAEIYDGVDLGEEEFDYDEFVENEFGTGVKPRRIATIWWITSVVLVLAFLAYYFYAR